MWFFQRYFYMNISILREKYLRVIKVEWCFYVKRYDFFIANYKRDRRIIL